MLDYWGEIDDVIPPASMASARSRMCAAGIAVRKKVYPLGLHATTIVAASPDVVDWVGARLAGRPDAGNC